MNDQNVLYSVLNNFSNNNDAFLYNSLFQSVHNQQTLPTGCRRPHEPKAHTHTQIVFAFTLFVVRNLFKAPSHCILRYENSRETFLLHHARAPQGAFNRSISTVKSGRKLIATQAETNRHKAFLLLFVFICVWGLVVVASRSLLTSYWLFFLVIRDGARCW